MPEQKEKPSARSSRARESQGARTRQLWLTVAVLMLALWIALPFLTPVAWAAILAIAEWPLYRRAIARFPAYPSLVAFAFMLATALLVIIPLSIAAVALASESQNALGWLKHAQQFGIAAPSWLAGIPLLGERASSWWQAHIATSQGANAMLGTISAGAVLGWTQAIGGEVAKDSALFLVTLIVLVTLLVRGGDIAAQAGLVTERMFGSFGSDFLERMTGAVRATVNGTVFVSFGEGALIGVGYAIASVPQPLLFATFTILLALIPFGAWLAFGLASLILIGGGKVVAGALLFGFGVIVMLVGDNLVQPTVIGSAVELPFVFAMLGVFGGLATLGLVGLFIGPVVMAAVLLLWREWVTPPAATARKARATS
ncbi:MAG: AI-2E family transporter [Pseudomonadota bacterium]